MKNTENTTYLFQLGREPALSVAEIFALFRLNGISYTITAQTNSYLVIQSEKPIHPDSWMKRLGGTIKIGEQLIGDNTPNIVVSDYLEKAQPEGKIIFSLSGDNAKKTALSIKKHLKETGRSVRYIEARNTATILHNNLIEHHGDITIFQQMVFVTKAIQDIEAFGARDYGRPGRSAKRGMLPPKLARIMINLAEMKKNSVLLDPFCGSGTVLMEAGLMEYNTLIGSDISSDAISDTKKSLEWLKEEYHLTPMTFTLHKSDAGKINKILKPKSVDCIITEPYLGKPLTGKESKTELEQQAATLKTLYLQAFTSFRDVLKKDGTIIFAIPAFRYGQQWIHIDCTKEMQKIGFIQKSLSDTSAALLYARKNQHVGRSISKWQCQ